VSLPGRRGVFRLRIALDHRYPGIIRDWGQAIEDLVPRNRVVVQPKRGEGVPMRDERGWASRRLDESALARAEKFCLELIARLDAEVGPALAAAHARDTALSES
jgi:hypothetical protein